MAETDVTNFIPPTAEDNCATCGKSRKTAVGRGLLEGLSMHHDETSDHPFKPPDADAVAAPLSAWDREIAEMYGDIIDRGIHLGDRCSYDGDHPCTCYVKAHLDMVIKAAEAPRVAELEAALRFYADHRLPDREVNVSVATGTPHSFKYIDHGDVARAALSPSAEEGGE